MQELTQFCPVQCRIIDVSPIGILGLCNAKGCRCCLVLDSAATDQSCSEWAPAGLPLILPTLIGGDGEGVDALLGNSQFFTQWPHWRLSLSLVRNSPDPSPTPTTLPRALGDNQLVEFDGQPLGWWLAPDTGTATALPCSLSPNISECAGRQSEPGHISGTLLSLAYGKARVFPHCIFLYPCLFLSTLCLCKNKHTCIQ